MSKRNKGRLAPFVPITRSILDLPVWKACSPGARLLYIALKRFLNEKLGNNGKIYLSYRNACKAIGTKSIQSIARWFAELEFYGFIVKTTEGCLGVDGKGLAPHYRLTECFCDGKAATRDFERWDGTPFNPKRWAGKKQNPVPVVGTPRTRGGYIRQARLNEAV
jgi:hypothetical protein